MATPCSFSKLAMRSRKCSSSSSRVSGAFTPARNNSRRQAAMAFSTSNIFFLPQFGECAVHGEPLLALFFQHLFAVQLQRVIFAFASGLGFAPARFDQALVLHAMQHGI